MLSMLRAVKGLTLFAVAAIVLLLAHSMGQVPSASNSLVEGIRYVNISLMAQLICREDVNNPFNVYFPVPQDAENQKIISIQFSREPDEILEDEWNQSVAMFRVPGMRRGESQQISMFCVAKLTSMRYDVDPAKAGSVDDVPYKIRLYYTRDEEMYRIRDPIIARSQREAVGEERNSYEIVLKAHDYVIERLEYELDERWDSAPITLKRGTGSCSEYVFAFIAICRASGLPARFVGGTVIDPSYAGMFLEGEIDDYVFHRWAEVYIPNYGWLPVDVTFDDGPYRRRFLFSLTNTFFALTRRGGPSKYLGWSYLPVLDQGVEGVVLRARATWAPIREAQRAILLIWKAERIIQKLESSKNQELTKAVELLRNSIDEMDRGNFGKAISLSKAALDILEKMEGSRDGVFKSFLFLLPLIAFLSILFFLKSPLRSKQV